MDSVFINVNVGAVSDQVKTGVRLRTRNRQPLDLAYCAAVLEQNGFACRIIDALALNLSDEEVIKDCGAPYVIINTSPIDRWECPYLCIERHAELAKKIRKATKAKIIFIGPHGTVTPEWVFQKADIDAVVMGEPEYAVLDIVKELPYEKIDGIAFRKDNRVIINRPRDTVEIDLLPFPSYHLLPMERYSDHIVNDIQPFTLMVGSRGCPFRCTFCMRKMWGDECRFRSIDSILDEIKLLQKDHGIRAVYFQDLEFCFKKERVKEFCRKLINSRIQLVWACSGRLHNSDEEMYELMKEAGCIHIHFGLESGSQKILDNVKKNINLQKASETIQTLRKVGMRSGFFFQIGLPGETRETLKESIRFAVENGIEFWGGALPIPYPGTELWDGQLTWDQAGDMAGRIGTDILQEFTEKQLYRYVRMLYIKERYSWLFFLNPSFYRVFMQMVLKKYLFKKKVYNKL